MTNFGGTVIWCHDTEEMLRFYRTLGLEFVECLPMWQPKIVKERCNGSQVGWLGVQATVPMLTHFTGWNVFLDDGLEVPFDMRANGKTVKGAFE